MGILNHITIELKPEQVTAVLSRGVARRSLVAGSDQVLAMARELIRPAAVFEWVNIARLGDGRLQLQWPGRDLPTVLHLGPHADLMEAAQEALVSVVTIGKQLDARSRGLHEAGENLQAYLLDCIGVLALGETGQALRRMAEKRAAGRRWGVGASLAPGSLDGWDLQEQSDLCAGLDLGAVGVHLNAAGVLVPFKSASGLIGIGPNYPAERVASICRFCQHAATCWRAEIHGDGQQ